MRVCGDLIDSGSAVVIMTDDSGRGKGLSSCNAEREATAEDHLSPVSARVSVTNLPHTRY